MNRSKKLDKLRLLREFEKVLPEISIETMENIDLVFDAQIDQESLEEFLLEIEDAYGVRFNLDFRRHFPNWFSIFWENWLMDLFPPLHKLRRKRFEPLTPEVVWRSLSK